MIKSNSDILNRKAVLNFAFCPNAALKSKNNFDLFLEVIKKILPNNGNVLTVDDHNTISEAARFFYVCYCLKFEDNSQYFYFQTFLKVGEIETIHLTPVYGFFTKNEILQLIQSIDEVLEPQGHDKQIFDHFLISEPIEVSSILSIMTLWTSSKIDEFKNLFYKSDELASQNAIKLSSIFKKIKSEQPKTKKQKIKPVEKTKQLNKKDATAKGAKRTGTSKNKQVDKSTSKRKIQKKSNN